jgi:hypothetical protein
MPSSSFRAALARELPVLFVNIGWTIYYDGSETVVGGHGFLRDNPGSRVGESSAFKRSRDGYYECGIGDGSVTNECHIAFVARDPGDRNLKLVGIYAAATPEGGDGKWSTAYSRFVRRIPIGQRPVVTGWPRGRSMRRWAERGGQAGTEHNALKKLFARMARALQRNSPLPDTVPSPTIDDDTFEGQGSKAWRRHRKREAKLRKAKIAVAMSANAGRLVCEVLHCKFDFSKVYGELGAGFAEVHHRIPLSEAPKKGRRVRLADLAIVCANCHRMIHRNRQCRSLASLIR